MPSIQHLEFVIDADHYQFYLEDITIAHDTSLLWAGDDFENRLGVLPGLVAVETARYGQDVPVRIVLASNEPTDDDFTQWDHVVDCSIEAHSDELYLTNPQSFPISRDNSAHFAISPGRYRARVYYGSLDTVRGAGDLEGDDHYQLTLWLGDTVKTRVLKHNRERI